MKKTHYALILGASSGFGKAISLALAGDGVNILGVHLDRASTMPAVDEHINNLKSFGIDVHFFNANAADPHKRSDILDEIQNKIFTGKDNPVIKVLVHSLAFGTLRNFIEENPANALNQKQMEMTIDVMANSLVYWTQDIVHRNLMKEGGKIYAMTSSGSKKVIPFYGAVSAAKACLESHIRQLAYELGNKGIAANTILAGVTDTPALNKIPGAMDLKTAALRKNPQGRLTTTEDIANFILDNYKRDSHWMTGCIIHLDGGESITE